MLDIACKYELELQGLFCDIIFDKNYMFYTGSSYRMKYEADVNTWEQHEFVSLDKDKNILGYIAYNINRDSMVADGLRIVNFTNKKAVFGRDVMIALDEIFTKFNFRKLCYCVFIGNPVEGTYDRLTEKYGGRIVGVQYKENKLLDGNYYDCKLYEIFRDDYLKNKK